MDMTYGQHLHGQHLLDIYIVLLFVQTSINYVLALDINLCFN